MDKDTPLTIKEVHRLRAEKCGDVKRLGIGQGDYTAPEGPRPDKGR